MATRGNFFARVYELVARIPRGKVMTYGQIARRLGGFYSGRVTGFAMRAAPGENLPCHRVVNKKGEMAPGFCFGGAENQRRLLEKEGVRFLPDGRIDMAKSQVGLDEELPEGKAGSPEMAEATKTAAPPRRQKTREREKGNATPARSRGGKNPSGKKAAYRRK